MRGAREKLIELYNKWTGKTGKCKEIKKRERERRRGKGKWGTDTSTTDKLDILLPIRIQIDEGLRSVDRMDR